LTGPEALFYTPLPIASFELLRDHPAINNDEVARGINWDFTGKGSKYKARKL
jgi:hypothetical protein